MERGDTVDLASEVETAARERAIAAARGCLAGEGSDLCADCGEEIPEARRRALPSATRCVGCQSGFERERAR